MRILLIGLVFAATTVALTDGLDPVTRALCALSPVVLIGLLRLAWSTHKQELPPEAYSLLTDNPVAVPPPRRPEPSTGDAVLDHAARAIADGLGESMFK